MTKSLNEESHQKQQTIKCAPMTSSVPPPSVEEGYVTTDDENEDDDGDGLLVSEFPPPPYYYKDIVADELEPPPIPAHLKAQRCFGEAKFKQSTSNIESVNEKILDAATFVNDAPSMKVFGQAIEDPIYLSKSDNDQDGTPTLVEQDEEDPCVIRDAMNRLNHEVVSCFVNLVDGLVQNPKEDMKEKREILSNNLINMHQEANKFREHQAREILIDILQRQVRERKEVLDELLGQIQKANNALESIPKS